MTLDLALFGKIQELVECDSVKLQRSMRAIGTFTLRVADTLCTISWMFAKVSRNNRAKTSILYKGLSNITGIYHFPAKSFSTTMKQQALKKFHFDLPSNRNYGLIKVDNSGSVNSAKNNNDFYTFDKNQFSVKIPLVAVIFPDPKNISYFCKNYRQDVFNCERLTNIVKLCTNKEDSEKKQILKGVLLKEEIDDVSKAETLLSPETYKFLQENNCTFKPYEYHLDYDFWKVEEVLCKLLPPGLNSAESIPSSYTSTGHIAHVNLRSEYKPYGEVIGQVILDKNQPKVQLVVDKLDSINSKFRTFDMKILACTVDMDKQISNDLNSIFEVTHKESNCFFKFDFSKVYWNSRLHTEHERLIEQAFQKGELVGDVFAGVGPFSVPAGKKQVFVMSNDLNPYSFKYMQENITVNKVSDFVKPLNLDGVEFIQNCIPILNDYRKSHTDARIKILKKIPNNKKKDTNNAGKKANVVEELIDIPKFYHHFVMNLPDTAITFLHNFIGIYTKHFDPDNLPENFQLPYVHVHCFEKYLPEEAATITDHEVHSRIHQRVLQELDLINDKQHVLPLDKLKFHLVRKVAPTKPMYCVSFQLPQKVVFG